MKHLKWVVSTLAVFLIIGVSFYIWRDTSRYVYTRDANISAFSVDVSPDILARVMQLKVDEGDYVKRGDVISQLQDDVLLAQKREAEANIIKLEEDVKFREAEYEKIRNDYYRAEKGIVDKVISAQTFDHKQKDYEMAEAKLEYAAANLEFAIKQLDVIKTQLTHTVIVAPMNGMIAKRWVLSGDVMNPGQTMFTMYDLDNVWVTALLEEKKISKVRVGDRVKIHVDAYKDYEFEGRVFVIKGAAASNFSLIPQDNATGNYTKVEQRIPIKITVERPQNFPKDQPLYLLPGMSVETKIYVKKE